MEHIAVTRYGIEIRLASQTNLPWKMTCEGITIRLGLQGSQWVPQWQRLTAHWTDFRRKEKILVFPSAEKAFAFANLLLKNWEERDGKETWKDVRTRVCQESVC